VGDPDLPRSHLGIPDWDHVDSWNAAAAIEALHTLVETGSVDVPLYDISKSAVTGHHTVKAAPGTFILAEGLFAPRLVQPHRDAGLLADAICVRRNRWHTFVLRLARDLSERRKPPHILLRRGIALLRDDRRVVEEATSLGARPITPRRAEGELWQGAPPRGNARAG
jgi:uridine kinase